MEIHQVDGQEETFLTGQLLFTCIDIEYARAQAHSLVSTLGLGDFCPCLNATFLENGAPDATPLTPLAFFLEQSKFVIRFCLSDLISKILPRIFSPTL